ncbi:MAG: serine/threonine-protein phosphatase, partial [Gloeocapsa sp. DLM2.Bin57]
MRNTGAKIQCTNPNCQVFNLESENFCSQCRTPVIKRYLWGMGTTAASFKTGELVGDRYLVKQPRIFLDIKPGQIPDLPEDLPAEIAPYLLLFPYRLHLPQIYGLLPNPLGEVIWLLEYNYLPLSKESILKNGELFSPLTEVWSEASGLRQLNWLWQMATLWQPLFSQKAAWSLLNPSLLKTKGQMIQLQELDLNPEPEPQLADLGNLWTEWVKQSSPEIKDFLAQLCTELQTGQIKRVKKLVSILDQAIYKLGKEQQRNYQVFTLTDAGPSREHNEDNCYPSSGSFVKEPSMAIVCDGLGGQEGGEIASRLAVEILEEQLNQLNFEEKLWRPEANIKELDRIIREANDKISERNDLEKRKERQRMGTTLVMTVAQAHELYYHYIGDSRIYLITKNGTYQLTVDDDLASREVRLGYSLYRDALQYPNSGALTQALGMASSGGLHINHRRLILDEDCLLLLCSDGLSDYDRIEQYWENKILPALTQGISLATIGSQLINMANEKNGHDNATIALLHCQVTPLDQTTNLVWSEIQPSIPTIPPEDNSEDLSLGEMPTVPVKLVSPPENIEPLLQSKATQEVAQPQTTTKSSPFKPLVALLSLLLLGGLGGLGWFVYKNVLTTTQNASDPVNIPNPINPDPTPESPQDLKEGDIIQITDNLPTVDSNPEAEATPETDNPSTVEPNPQP